MNPIDYLLLLLIAGAMFLALRRMYKDRKSGKSCSCGSGSSFAGCSACAMHDTCSKCSTCAMRDTCVF